jgi:hypothetical protein
MKGRGHGLIWNTTPVFVLKDWGKSRKTLGHPAENWTQDPSKSRNATPSREVADIFNTCLKQLNWMNFKWFPQSVFAIYMDIKLIHIIRSQ